MSGGNGDNQHDISSILEANFPRLMAFDQALPPTQRWWLRYLIAVFFDDGQSIARPGITWSLTALKGKSSKFLRHLFVGSLSQGQFLRLC